MKLIATLNHKIESTSLYKYLERFSIVKKIIQSWYGKVLILLWVGKAIPFYIWLFKIVKTEYLQLIKIKLQYLFFVLAAFSISLNPAFSQGDLDKGNQWYENRAKANQTADAAINLAIHYYERSLKVDSLKFQASVGLLKAYYFKATSVSVSKKEKKSLYNNGQRIGTALLETHPNSAPVLYWTASHWCQWARYYGVFAAARQGVANKVKKLCERLIEIDPSYRAGGGYRVMGLLHQHAPRIPFILSWPSNAIAKLNFSNALEISADNPGNIYVMANFLVEEGNEKEALSLLFDIEKIKPRKEYFTEDSAVIEKAKTLKESLIEKYNYKILTRKS